MIMCRFPATPSHICRVSLIYYYSLERLVFKPFFFLFRLTWATVTIYHNTFFPKTERSEPLDRRAYILYIILYPLMRGSPR